MKNTEQEIEHLKNRIAKLENICSMMAGYSLEMKELEKRYTKRRGNG